MTETEYIFKLPKQQVLFLENELTFSINHIKSRLTSVLYFKMYFYDKKDTLIYTYTSPRWVIDTEYHRRSHTFTVNQNIVDKSVYVQIELIAIGITSENPLYFTELMLNEGGELDGYHIPNEKVTAEIGFLNNRYVNLYDDENYLQVIRPNGESFHTNMLDHCSCTVLAPHLADESDIDDPVNIFMEFINQVDQEITVLR